MTFGKIFAFALIFVIIITKTRSVKLKSKEGKRAVGRRVNLIKSTNRGYQRQIKKLEKFVEVHKDIESLNFDQVTKIRRTKKIDEVKKRLDALYQRESTRRAMKESRPGLSRATYSLLTTNAINKGQIDVPSSKPSSSTAQNTVEPTPDSVMTKHFGGWKVPKQD